ncbi:unnamed protein product, partial [Boreogadus saida]
VYLDTAEATGSEWSSTSGPSQSETGRFHECGVQLRGIVDLDLTAVPQEDWGRYECVVQLKGIEDISTPLDPALIRTNGGKSHLLVFLLVGVAVAAVVVAAAAVGVFVYQKRNDSDKRHKPVGSSDSCSENTEGHNPAPEAQPLTT